MRQITRDSVNAFLNGTRFARGNMTVAQVDGLWCLMLHANVIATRNADGTITLSDAGWRTNTTKDRLNGVLDIMGRDEGITQIDFTWYLVDRWQETKDSECLSEHLWNGSFTFDPAA